MDRLRFDISNSNLNGHLSQLCKKFKKKMHALKSVQRRNNEKLNKKHNRMRDTLCF